MDPRNLFKRRRLFDELERTRMLSPQTPLVKVERAVMPPRVPQAGPAEDYLRVDIAPKLGIVAEVTAEGQTDPKQTAPDQTSLRAGAKLVSSIPEVSAALVGGEKTLLNGDLEKGTPLQAVQGVAKSLLSPTTAGRFGSTGEKLFARQDALTRTLMDNTYKLAHGHEIAKIDAGMGLK